jgi:hypothetical protein
VRARPSAAYHATGNRPEDNTLRILHVTDRLNERGGAQRYLLSLLNAQRDAGHELHLACAEVTSALAAWAAALVDSTEIIGWRASMPAP